MPTRLAKSFISPHLSFAWVRRRLTPYGHSLFRQTMFVLKLKEQENFCLSWFLLDPHQPDSFVSTAN
jgi:hypothetical protein